MRRLSLFLVLVAFTFSCGGQWAVLQGIAWVSMVQEYSSMVTLPQAVEMTLSGRYPCALCKEIAEKKQSDQTKALSLPKQEKLICSAGLIAKVPADEGVSISFSAWEMFLQTRTDVPPTPPPRLA